MGPTSALTREHPDLWRRALSLATSLTGYRYEDKKPLADGTIWACYGGGYTPPRPRWDQPLGEWTDEELRNKIDWYRREIEKGEHRQVHEMPGRIEEVEKEIQRRDPEEARRREAERIERERQNEIGRIEKEIDQVEKEISDTGDKLSDLIDRLGHLREQLGKKRREGIQAAAPVVFVPDGALDWLLHEVGHYLAATPAERGRQGYGISVAATIHAEDHRHQNHAADREWQAWAFQEIVLAPFGYARELTPPSYRGGVGYQRSGPIDSRHIDHIGKQLRALGLDIEPWRLLAGEWVKWGKSRGAGHAPWETEH